MHAKVILAQDVFDYAPLFAEIADAYYDSKMYADAKPIYETLAHDAAVCGCGNLHRWHVFNKQFFVPRRVAYTYFCKWLDVATCLATSARPLMYMNMVWMSRKQ